MVQMIQYNSIRANEWSLRCPTLTEIWRNGWQGCETLSQRGQKGKQLWKKVSAFLETWSRLTFWSVIFHPCSIPFRKRAVTLLPPLPGWSPNMLWWTRRGGSRDLAPPLIGLVLSIQEPKNWKDPYTKQVHSHQTCWRQTPRSPKPKEHPQTIS